MKIIKYPTLADFSELLRRPAINDQNLDSVVSDILLDVKTNGDAALKRYAEKFDGVVLEDLRVTEDEFKLAESLVSPELKKSIETARKNIEKFHASQVESPKIIETSEGIQCWRKSVAISKVGLYIPGGTAPLFSTVLMLGVPALIAGCKEVILCSPSDKNGKIHEAVLFTASLLGIKKVYKVGGAQAIGAMAYGTETIPAVYKIFGPGNQYVTCAKQLIQKAGVAIDMPAGPSELAVFADETCVPAFVAADLLSQAEHGTDSQVILVSTSEDVIEKVIREVYLQLELLPRKKMASESLSHSKAILLRDDSEALHLLNEYAPEHLILACKNYESIAEQVENAGSVFLGNFSCESAGDYASGTNHTLPTNGYAKAFSGVSLDSFLKKITFQKITETGLASIADAIERMAEAEGLQAHKNAVSIRINKTEK
ncbi:MAG: histidinol dehydrogenase [Bacteroidota bacterium]|nr:histidinol dehydrogenase [Bacteroidota bacterium]